MKRSIFTVFCCLLLVLIISACSSSSDDENDDNSADGDSDAEVYVADGDKQDSDGDEESAMEFDMEQETEKSEEENEQELEQDQDQEQEPLPPAFEGYMAVALHSSNTANYTGNALTSIIISEEGQFLEPERLTIHEHPSDAAFTEDGRRLVVVHEGGEIVVLETEGGTLSSQHDLVEDGYFEEVIVGKNEQAYILDGNPLDYGGGLRVLDLQTNPPSLTDDHLQMFAPSGLALSPDQNTAVVFGVKSMDDTEDTVIIDLSSSSPSALSYFDFWTGQPTVVNPNFSPDGTMLAAGNDSMFDDDAGFIRLFSVSAGNVIAEIDNIEVQTPNSFVFSDDNSFLFALSVEGNKLERFSIDSGELTHLGSISGLPLATEIIAIRKGPLAGHLVVTPYLGVVLFKVEDDGSLTEVDRYDFESSAENFVNGLGLGHCYE